MPPEGNQGNAAQGTAPAAEPATQPKMVPESDLLAVKAGRESLQAKLAEAETRMSDASNKLLQAEAKVADLEARMSSATATVKELETIKQQLVTAQGAVEGLGARALEYRRRLVAGSYNIPADTLKDKTLEQLDVFEEALKALKVPQGTGNYAVGAGSGSTAKLETPLERAHRVLEEAEKRGNRIAAPLKSGQ